MSRIIPASIPHYRADIDGLRAIAILLVVWFHAFPESMPGGFIGVDVFFVISGFLITGIVLRGLHKESFCFLHFYTQRARRLLPALSLVLPATLAAGWHWLWPQEYAQLSAHVAAAAAFVLNIVLWTEAGYFDAATELKPLMHLWSLGIEEQFYLVYPFLLWAGWRLRLNPIVVIAAVVALSFMANLLTLSSDPAGTFFLPHTRFWELAMGGALAWWAHRRQQGATLIGNAPAAMAPSIWQQLLPCCGLLAIAVGAWTFTPDTPYPGTAALLPVLGSLILVSSRPDTWVNRNLLANRVMVLVGLVSYPLYLWHWPILSFMRIIHSEAPPLSMRWLAVGLSFLLAWLTFRFVETPVRFGARKVTRLAGVAVMVACTAAVAVAFFTKQGVPSRLPEQARDLLVYQYDYRDAYREGSCFLRPEQEASEFSLCADTWPQHGQGWLLWGDSHAAHVFPGMHARYGNNAVIIQRTASGCPPLHGEAIPNRPHCPQIQEQVWREIETHRPYRVTLAARWDSYDWAKLADTVKRLRKLGVEHIQVVGPVPQWHNGLPRQMAIAYRENGFSTIPSRLARGLNPEPFAIDQAMQAIAREWGVEYLSPIQQLCNTSGCLTLSQGLPAVDRFPPNANTVLPNANQQNTAALLAWDDAHLTSAGSILLTSEWPSP